MQIKIIISIEISQIIVQKNLRKIYVYLLRSDLPSSKFQINNPKPSTSGQQCDVQNILKQNPQVSMDTISLLPYEN